MNAVGRSEAAPRVFVLGATGTIGRATVRALVHRGYDDVVCFVRPRVGVRGELTAADSIGLLAGASLRLGDVTDAGSLARDGFGGEHFDAMVSCLVSRTGAPESVWAIDYRACVREIRVVWSIGKVLCFECKPGRLAERGSVTPRDGAIEEITGVKLYAWLAGSNLDEAGSSGERSCRFIAN